MKCDFLEYPLVKSLTSKFWNFYVEWNNLKFLETKTEEKVEIKSETAPSSGEPAVETAVETS